MAKKTSEKSIGFSGGLGIEMVDIFVGPSKQQFRIHKALLCSRVEYFKKMFESGMIEAEENGAALPEEDPIVFGLFVEYLYRGGRLGPVDIKTSTSSTGPVVDRIKLYGFAEKMCLTDLQDYLMTNLVSNLAHYDRTPSKEGVKLAYEVSRAGSPMRDFISHCLFYIMKFDGEDTPWSSRVLSDVLGESDDMRYDMIAVTRKHEINHLGYSKKAVDPRIGLKCRWHSHAEGVECLLQGEIL